MKRFRINKDHQVKINILHNGNLVIKTLIDSGFTTISEAQNYAKSYLPWNLKGYGKRIEIAIHNLDTQESKYINTFS